MLAGADEPPMGWGGLVVRDDGAVPGTGCSDDLLPDSIILPDTDRSEGLALLRHSILLSHALAAGATWALVFVAADKSGMEPVTGTDLLGFRSPLVYGPIAAAVVIAVGVSLVGSRLAFQRVVLQAIPWMTSPLMYAEVWLYAAMLGRIPSIAVLAQSLVPLGAVYVLTVGPWHLIRRWRCHGGDPSVPSA